MLTRKNVNALIGIILFLLSSTYTLNSKADDSFSGLKSIEVPRLFDVGEEYGPYQIRVFYDPKTTKLINKKSHYEDGGFDIIQVLETKIDRNSDKRFRISYSPGGSGDPAFGVVDVSTGKPTRSWNLPGCEIIIPGNRYVYIRGHTNNYFDQHKKFSFQSGKLVEVKQPFYFVGIESKAKRSFEIYLEKNNHTPVASVPAGAKVTVVLNDGDYYLIKTEFGLLGWVSYDTPDPFLDGLFFAGD